jgi:hypothetical protein
LNLLFFRFCLAPPIVPFTFAAHMFTIRQAPLRSLLRVSQPLYFSKPGIRTFATSRMGAPVILCGKTEAVGTGVIASLKPEFDGA